VVGEGVWVAQSGAVNGIGELTEAARQAAYVAGLIGAGLIERSSVRFDSATELGGFSLLYRFWGTSELTDFAGEILGDLLNQDKSGVLRQTLLHFLESGGSRVEAAERAAIHRNTLAYRLRRIAELTKLNPHLPGDRLSLHLAILAQSIPAATSDIPLGR
jgi:DNA-binding PucR family transcriptional regulator